MHRDRTDSAFPAPAAGCLDSCASGQPCGFAELAQLAAGIFRAPLASIALAGRSDSWFSAAPLPVRGAAVNPYLARTLAAPGVFEVHDVVHDVVQDGGLGGIDPVLDAAGIRSYAGCAVRGAAGETLGALAIYRTSAVALTDAECAVLAGLARQAARLVELHSPAAHARALAASLLDSAPVAIYYGDTRSESTYVNPQYRRMFRLEPGQDVNDWPAALHPEDRARIEQRWAEFLHHPFDIRLEYRALDEGGAVRYYTEHAVPTRGIPGFVGTISDITDLVQTRRELVKASREAGRAEVATNVLHNVGNILNSVNVSANLVTERIKRSRAPGVSRVAALLSEHAVGADGFLAGDPRGRRVPGYLSALGAELSAERRDILEELASLRENLEHIKDAVMMQQSYAKLCGIAETVEVAALVEDSLRLDASALERQGVRLRREYEEVPPITVDRHKVLQILVNLLQNAKYACDESGHPHKLITLRIDSSPRGVRISVTDNGVGIAPETMEQLFRHGFTTRESGHGFGLHGAALAARDLGGTLHAESAGLGSGAAFILELPLAPPPAAIA